MSKGHTKKSSVSRERPAPSRPPDSAGERSPRDVVLVLLALIVVFGAWLRFTGLSHQSLWNDELNTWEVAKISSLQELLTEGMKSEVNPPLYFIIMHYVYRFAGGSEAILRTPSAVAGVLTIIAMYLFGRRLYSETEGLISAAIVAVMWVLIYYSQEARAYAVMLLFTLVASWFWVSVMACLCRDRKPPLRDVIGYVVTAGLCCHVHYFGLGFIALQGLTASAWLLACRRWKRALIYLPVLYVPVALIYLPWVPATLKHLAIRHFWIKRPGPDALYKFFMFAFYSSKVVLGVALAIYAWLLGRTFYLRFGRRRPARKPEDEPYLPKTGLLLVIWLLAPFTFAYVRSLVSTPLLMNRNLIASLPAAYLLVARGIAVIPVRKRVIAAITLLMVALMAVDLIFYAHYYTGISKDQIRHAVGLIVKNDARAPDSMIIGCSFGKHYLDYYWEYYEERTPFRRGTYVKAATKKDIDRVAMAIEERRPQHIWFIFGHRRPDEELLAFMERRYRFLGGWRLRNAGVFLFKNEPPPARPFR